MNEKKRTLIIAVLIVIVLGGAVFAYNYLVKGYDNNSSLDNESTKEQVLAKDFTVYDTDGKEVKLSDYRGKKAVVINMWASWCPPCKMEMPYFQNATDKYKDNDVEILMVNLTDGKRETKEKALDYMASNNYSMKVLFDEDFSAADTYVVNAIPRTLFIDKDGNLAYDHTGAMDEETLYYNIDKILK